MRFHALEPSVDQYDRHPTNHRINSLDGQAGLVRHDLLIEPLNERIVLFSQEARLIIALFPNIIRFKVSIMLQLLFRPFLGFYGLLSQFGDYARELQYLMVDGVHLILIFEQVVLMDVLDLEFVVLRPTRLNAVTIVEDPE